MTKGWRVYRRESVKKPKEKKRRNKRPAAFLRAVVAYGRLPKKLAGYQGLSYLARLDKARLHTLELRRLRADLCFCYKILHGLIDTPIHTFFVLDRSGLTRGHKWKLKPITPRLDTRLYFFSFRVVNVWNALSPPTVDATTFNSFRVSLMSECLDSFLTIKD